MATGTNRFGSTVNKVWYKPGIPGPYRAGHVPGVIGIDVNDQPDMGAF